MKFIKIKKWPFSNVDAITIFPLVFISAVWYNDPVLRNHENIHGEQYKELFVVGFWLLYLWFYVRGLAKYRDLTKAYERIPFEQEAYGNAENEKYLGKRKPYAWRNFKV